MAAVDGAELAWAAGFFDGEGTTIARGESRRPEYHQLRASVPQRGHDSAPHVLLRFQKVVLGMGYIEPPTAEGVYTWRARGFEEAQALIALLWRHLGPVKKAQAAAAMRVVRAQYENGRYAPRPPRRSSVSHTAYLHAASVSNSPLNLEPAWAAGFLDAEGCFGVVRSRPRRRGAAWYRIRVSASQHGDEAIPAEVLERLQRALGIGRIERHGEADDFKWLAEGPSNVERVLAITAAWLGPVKLRQAHDALEAFAAQVRLKGDAARCVRGHAYDHQAIRGDRRRKICNTCARLCARQRRAAQGIKPRQFKDLRRRYTS